MPKSPSDQKTSAISWTTPEPGDVISYAYLWHREARLGQEEGLKDRPSVVIVAQQMVQGRTRLIVVPITHSAPDNPSDAIEIPKSVKRQLGLDDSRSWIVVTEVNQFFWPGPDVRIVPGTSPPQPLFGAIPEWLFERVRVGLLAGSRSGRLRTTPRSA